MTFEELYGFAPPVDYWEDPIYNEQPWWEPPPQIVAPPIMPPVPPRAVAPPPSVVPPPMAPPPASSPSWLDQALGAAAQTPVSSIAGVEGQPAMYYGPNGAPGTALTPAQQDWLNYTQTNRLPASGGGVQVGVPMRGNDGQYYVFDAAGNLQPFRGDLATAPTARPVTNSPNPADIAALFNQAFPSAQAPGVPPELPPSADSGMGRVERVPITQTGPAPSGGGGGLAVPRTPITSGPGVPGGQLPMPNSRQPVGQVSAGNTPSGVTGGAQNGTGAANPRYSAAYGTNPSPGAVLPRITIPLGAPSSGGSTGGGITLDENGVPLVGKITLPDTPMMSSTFDPAVQGLLDDLIRSQADNIGSYYEGGAWPTMEAAQMNLADIPRVTAAQVGVDPALAFLLSGEGYSPDVMSKLRGQSVDALSRSAVSDRSSARLAAERAGLSRSPAGYASELDLDRRLNDSIASAKNSLDIENAQRGLENLRTGAAMDLTRRTTNMGAENAAALENAAKLFSGMTQNVANVQTAGLTNTTNQQNRELARAGAQAQNTSNLGSMYGSATIDRANTADQTNTSNKINRGLNQGQLDRAADTFNVGTQQGAYNSALNAYIALANGSGSAAAGYNGAGANSSNGQVPNLFPAGVVTNSATTIAELLRQLNRGQTPSADQQIH